VFTASPLPRPVERVRELVALTPAEIETRLGSSRALLD
jgi:hypothetical protein